MFERLINAIKNKTCLIFDFDLTIAKMEIDWSNWHPGIAKIYSQFDRNHGYVFGVNPHNFYNSMVQKHGYELVKAIRKFNADYEKENNVGFIPSSYLVGLIKTLKNKKLYIYSSNSKETIDSGLRKLGILDHFQLIVSRDDTKYLKPNQEGFGLIPGLKGNEALFIMIGDSSSDEKAAQSASIDFFKIDEFKTYKF